MVISILVKGLPVPFPAPLVQCVLEQHNESQTAPDVCDVNLSVYGVELHQLAEHTCCVSLHVSLWHQCVTCV